LAKDNKESANEATANAPEQRHPRPEHTSESGGRGFSLRDIEDKDAQAFVASAALIGIGALLEPELLGGMLIGAGAVYVSRNIPLIGGVLRPLVKTVVRVGYAASAKASEMLAEASEEVQDMVAEARADYRGMPPGTH
jgi:hypothetical protein